VQLTQRFPPAIGGVESHVYHLAMGLTKADVSTEIFTTDLQRDTPFQRLNGDPASLPFPVRRFRAARLADVPHGLGIVAPSMALAALEASPDVFHAHSYGYFPTFAGGFAKLMRGVPLVVTPHSDPGGSMISKRLFDRVVPPFTIRRASRVIALTSVEAKLLQRLGVPAQRIRVIPNGVDLNEFAGLPLRHPIGDATKLLFVGRCYPRQKGLEYLVKAIPLLPSREAVSLTIVGEDWGGVAMLRSLARSLGIEHQIVFKGALGRSDVIRAYASADIFVLPSLFEPFGIVLLEAMAAGLPVVASAVGGIVDVVADGTTGLLVPPGNPSALAAGLEHLIADSSSRARMGQEGRRRVLRYSWDLIVPKIVDVYREAIAESGGGRAS